MSPDSLQWVVSAYVLGYGGFLLLGGRLADVVDRKRLLIGSVVVFAIVSAVGGAATAGWVLIAARLAKGIAAAFSGPVALAILLHVHGDETERNRALGVYLSMAAVGFTSGLVLGGLVAAASRRLVLLVPAALALLAGRRRLHPARRRAARSPGARARRLARRGHDRADGAGLRRQPRLDHKLERPHHPSPRRQRRSRSWSRSS